MFFVKNSLHDTIGSLNTPVRIYLMLPSSIYIHIPWCIRKCPYCDFNSHQSPGHLPEMLYVDQLINDLSEDLTYLPSKLITSVFIGGGTPSLFSAKAYALLFEKLNTLLPFSRDAEITLEANPGSVEQQRFTAYRQIGINRLSLGIQSFNPQHLKKLGRIHNDNEAKQAIDTAYKAGFDNLNLDIMHGLPEQTLEEGIADLNEALSFGPKHLSWYQLTLEPNTVFYKHPPTLPSEEDNDTLEQTGLALLARHGFHRYEISAFARETYQSKHNLNYWLFGDYYGIGAGAHGKISLDDGKTIYRTQKARQPNDYLNPLKKHLVSQTVLSPETLLFEFMLNTTRLEQAIPYTLFNERTGLPIDYMQAKLQEAAKKGLLTLSEKTWQITALGRRFTNNLQALFLPD